MRVSVCPSLFAAAVTAMLTLAGCAAKPNPNNADAVADYNEANDPLEPTNRVFYAINNGLDTVLVRPLAVAYRYAVPQVIRDHTHNVLDNLSAPVTLFDDILQAKPRRAGDSLMRFVVNTTIGVAGVFDVATGLGWPEHDSDGGMTLAMWGLPEGPFLFLPVLGPTNPRDVAGFGGDIALDPTTWIGRGTIVTALGYTHYGLSAVDARERVLDDIDKIKAQALDPYATFRSLARQHRKSQLEDASHDEPHTIPAWFPQAATPSGLNADEPISGR